MKALCIFGTRPEAIKLAPVVAALRAADVTVSVCVTAQHRDLLDQVLEAFAIRPDRDLDLMTEDQSLSDFAAAALRRIAPILTEERPDWVIVQGDTTTAFVATLAAFHARVRVAHVEAGLRTTRIDRPFPEEANRRMVDLLADVLLAPTERARANLRGEGIADAKIHVTGNTIVDALQATLARPVSWDEPPLSAVPRGRRLVLATTHRREHFGPPLEGICRALAEIAAAVPDVELVLPTHPNPTVHRTVHRCLEGARNVTLLAPLGYRPFVHLLRAAEIVLTDSGGLQEEGAALGRPVLVLRTETERPEAVEAGAARLVGIDPPTIVAEALALLGDPPARARMNGATAAFGDGRAGARIARILRET